VSSSSPSHTGSGNRLAREASPYLLQHAKNPVDWWPWCDEALAEAKKRDVPILLSIGYSACHWCHVMERESFEDAGVAKLMNDLFVSVKVDREERPDLDQIYQLTVQLMGRTGGWPLTVFLTPEQKPFFAGTYFPPEDRYGMPGFPKILQAVAEAYRVRRSDVDEQAAELTRAIAEVGRGEADANEKGASYEPGPDLLERAAPKLLRRLDESHGGFGRAPKFPNTMPLEVLLRLGVLDGKGPAKDAARLALESMRKGGIWDQLGGGFHRYSTDERWLVPHFEKMLYDNALLLRAYVDGWRVFRAPLLADTAHAIFRYVAREMTDEEGGFYASQDADSEGEEGKFFVWDPKEIDGACAGDELAAKVAIEYFGVTEAGNFEEHGRPTFKTVLHESRPVTAVAAKLDLSEAVVCDALSRATKLLFEERETRPKPFRDEKILTSWNALLISSLAEAGAVLADPSMIASAERALAFIEKHLVVRQGDGDRVRALRLAKKTDTGWLVKGPGFLDDHAFLANAALDVYEATGDPRHVTLARGLADVMLDVFFEDGAGFFFTPKDGETLITRSRDRYDNTIPSGVSIACRALLRLGTLVHGAYAGIAAKELARSAPAAIENPFGFGQSLCELDRLVRGGVDVVLVGARNDKRTRELALATYEQWLPSRTIAWLDPNDPASRAACAELAEGKAAKDGPVAYVCRGRTCSLPISTPADLTALLESTP